MLLSRRGRGGSLPEPEPKKYISIDWTVRREIYSIFTVEWRVLAFWFFFTVACFRFGREKAVPPLPPLEKNKYTFACLDTFKKATIPILIFSILYICNLNRIMGKNISNFAMENWPVNHSHTHSIGCFQLQSCYSHMSAF